MSSYEINKLYKQLGKLLLVNGEDVGDTIELMNVSLRFDPNEGNIVSCRNISLPYLFGEMTWYTYGSESVDFISKFGSLWGKITDDGVTSNSAYGNILFHRYGFNQVDKIIELLQKDPNSRRAIINLNVPNPKVIETKDEPCTICLQFALRDNRLHCTTIMRSNDIWFGLPYDIVFFTEVQKHIADRLEVEVGWYNHFAMSLHVYKKDVEKLENVICREDYEKIEVDFSPLWNKEICMSIYDAVYESDNQKEEVMKQFEKYGMYVPEDVKDEQSTSKSNSDDMA